MDIGAMRLRSQRIAKSDRETPEDVVRWLVCVQAQDRVASKWAVGLRLAKSSDAEIERAVDEGRILRTHVMRWTWQLVLPEDARWILALVAPRMLKKYAPRHRALSLDASTFRKCHRALEKATRDGAHLTRAEISSVLERAGVPSSGEALMHLLGAAELEAIVCNGARRGKQMTWTRFDDRVPQSKPMDRRDALAELAWRYFRSRGPAMVDDFVWWSSSSTKDAREAIAANEHRLMRETIGTRTYWFEDTKSARGLYLLPAFDEFLVSYRRREDIIEDAHVKRINSGGGLLSACIVEDGRVIGRWDRDLETELFVRRKIDLAPGLKRYEAFLKGRPSR